MSRTIPSTSTPPMSFVAEIAEHQLAEQRPMVSGPGNHQDISRGDHVHGSVDDVVPCGTRTVSAGPHSAWSVNGWMPLSTALDALHHVVDIGDRDAGEPVHQIRVGSCPSC